MTGIASHPCTAPRLNAGGRGRFLLGDKAYRARRQTVTVVGS